MRLTTQPLRRFARPDTLRANAPHLLLAALIGVLFGWLVTFDWNITGAAAGDLGGSALRYARDLLRGDDPYAFEPTALNVAYPLPVALIGLPLAGLTDTTAAAWFFGLSSALLSWGILRTGEWWRLLMFASFPFFHAMATVQYTPLITAAWFFPVLAPMLVLVKPHIALPIALHRITWRGVVLAAVVGLASLAVYPSWPFRFLEKIGPYQSMIPMTLLPFGVLLPLALLRWRDERARLLLGMSVLPVRVTYDLVALWLIPTTRRQTLLLTIGSWLVPSMFGIYAEKLNVPLLFVFALVLVLWQGRGTRRVGRARATQRSADASSA